MQAPHRTRFLARISNRQLSEGRAVSSKVLAIQLCSEMLHPVASPRHFSRSAPAVLGQEAPRLILVLPVSLFVKLSWF